MKTSQQKGFTLIELLVVAAIITLLISIILSSLSSARQRANDSAKITGFLEVRKAINLYYSDTGFYPSTLVTLTPKYISAITPDMIYQATNLDNSACVNNCASYHLGVALTRIDNLVLAHDADLNAGGFNGKNDTCGAVGSANGPSVPDLCYDAIP